MNANCYSEDTEVLTDRGWMRFIEADITRDKFATRNPETGEFEWQTASKFHEAESDGTMYRASSKNVDLLVTGGHRLLVNRLPKGCPGVRHGDQWLVHAEDLYTYQSQLDSGGRAITSPATSKWIASDLEWFELPGTPTDYVRLDGEALSKTRGARSINGMAAQAKITRPVVYQAEASNRVLRANAEAICRAYDLPLESIQEDPHYFSLRMYGDDYAAFMGMYLSEGCVRATSSNISIAQEYESKGYVEFRDLLARILGREAPYHRGAFTFGHTALADYLRPFGKAHEKYIPNEVLNLSKRQLEIFWRFYVLGDGAIYSYTEIVTTCSKRMADGLQEVLQKIGLSSAVRPKGTPVKDTHHQQWQVQTRHKDAYRVNVEREAYDGKVYCVSVPNKTLYVRRNGYPTWCANTDLRMQAFFLQFFTSGAVPESLLIAPEGADLDTLEYLQQTWDSYMSGDVTKRYGAFYLPNGTSMERTEIPTYPTDLWDKVMRLTVMQYNLLPINLGFTDGVNRATAGTQMDLQERTGTFAYASWLEEQMNFITQELLELEVEVKLDTGRDKEDRVKEAQAWQIYINSAIASPDEAREELLGLKTDPNESVGRFFAKGNDIIPLSQLMAVAGQINPETGGPTGTPAPQAFVWPGEQAPNPPGKPGTPPNVPKPKLKPLEGPNQSGPVPRMSPSGAANQPGVLQPSSKAALGYGSIILVSEGKVFMQLREEGINDSAAGKWEFPGGHVEPGESIWDGAKREFEEEVGVDLPKSGRILGDIHKDQWTGYIVQLPKISDLDLTHRQVRNPELSGDPQARAWWSRKDLLTHPDRREEVKEEAREIAKYLDQPVTKAQLSEIDQFHRIADQHLTNVAKGSSKPFRFTWHSGYDGSILEEMVAKAEGETEPGKLRPTRMGPEAQALEIASAAKILNALRQMVDKDQVSRIVSRVPFVAHGLNQEADSELTNIWASGIAQQVQVDVKPFHAALTEVRQDATELGQREAQDLLSLPPDLSTPKPGISDLSGPSNSRNIVSDLVNDSSLWNFNADPDYSAPEMDSTTRKIITGALKEGLENEESPQQIGDRIAEAVGSPSRARMISVTQTAHYMTRASLVEFQRANVEMVDLLVEATACPICRAIADANPHPITDLAIDPPVHPNCRCALTPAMGG
jgi:8-oxo-dGTP pyrophosphatase MutT (NUDIX family)